MTLENHFVTEDDVRPARPDGTCFYCFVPLGQEHELGCVCRRKTVMVVVSFQLLKVVPEDWDEHMIEFHMNDGSSCCDNLVRELWAQLGRMEDKAEIISETASSGPCMCNYTVGRFQREATQEDVDIFGLPNDE